MFRGGGINLRLLICAVNGRLVSFAPARAWLNAGRFAMERVGQGSNLPRSTSFAGNATYSFDWRVAGGKECGGMG
jgi:hypothetical protein